MMWKANRLGAAEGYLLLPEDLDYNQVHSLDQSRVLMLPTGQPPELIDLKCNVTQVLLPQIGFSTNILGVSGTNILCRWDGTNQILVQELHGTQFVQRGSITLESGLRPLGVAYDAKRQLLAWAEASSLNSIHLASLETPGRRIKLKSDFLGQVPIRFNEDGNHLLASRGRWRWELTKEGGAVRVWNVETGQIIGAVAGLVAEAVFADGGRARSWFPQMASWRLPLPILVWCGCLIAPKVI